MTDKPLTTLPHDVGCECCGEKGVMYLHARCHMGGALQAKLDGEVLILECYSCNREVGRFKVERP